YLVLGTPGMPDMPLAERLAEAEVRHAGERARFEQLTVELAMRLRERPKDVAGWIMLGRAERLLGRYDASIDAFGGAIAAAGGEAEAAPDLLADLAESRVYAAGGIVEEAARRLFDAALARDPGHLKSRHYIAVARSQAGDDAGALALMRGIAAETPPDAPWLPALHQRMAQLEQRLGPQVAAAVQPERPAPRPDSTPAAIPGASTDAFTGAVAERGPDAAGMAAAETMAPEEREAFIRGMVERLADRLAAAPDDPEGWVRLGRAQAVLGDSEAARRAFERAATTWRARLDRTGSDAPERTEIENSLRQVEALL
ncbi:MAG: tetratricopeptide repeat protein, partial [Alphaproteobacteria bacterium]